MTKIKTTEYISHNLLIFSNTRIVRSIGSAKDNGGQYHFKDTSMIEQVQVQASICKSFLSKKQEIMVWHCRLGHLNFPYFRHLFKKK